MLRHPTTVWTKSGCFTGQKNPDLDANGRALAIELAAVFNRDIPGMVLTSDLKRANETAKKIAEASGATLVSLRDLREEYLGEWEGSTHQQIQSKDPDAYQRWKRGETGTIGCREGLQSVGTRAHKALAPYLNANRFLEPHSHLVVVSHVNTILALSGILLGLPPDKWLAMESLGYGHASLMMFRNNRWKLRAHNLDCFSLRRWLEQKNAKIDTVL